MLWCSVFACHSCEVDSHWYKPQVHRFDGRLHHNALRTVQPLHPKLAAAWMKAWPGALQHAGAARPAPPQEPPSASSGSRGA